MYNNNTNESWNISASHGKKHCENDLRPDRKYFILISLSHLLPRYIFRVYCSRVFSAIALGLPCAPRRYGYDSVVCVCNATYCDSVAELPEDLLQQGYYVHYVSSRDGDRLNVTTKPLAPSGNSFPHLPNTELVQFSVNVSERYQNVMGFGGALTDAAGINIASLSPGAQNQLLRQYFGDEGIGYTFIRIPMAGTDFSTHYYTYDDVANDESLSHFNLTEEDLVYKIRYVQKSMQMSPRPIRLFTAPWTAPAWMKEFFVISKASSTLQKKYYQLYADYFIKFLDAYKSHGLDFWALSPQNEPFCGLLYYCPYGNSMGMSPAVLRDWVKNHLGPTLHANSYKDLKIMIGEDQKIILPLSLCIMKDPDLQKYISGFSIHLYSDIYPIISPTSFLDKAHRQYPDKFILYTEASIPHLTFEPPICLGKWENAERYAQNILEVLNHWTCGWVDWNIALDTNGGPNYVSNTVDSPIIVNATSDEFYKQPMFYALAHISKYIPPGSQRIKMHSDDNKGLSSAAFLRDDGNIVIVILNSLDTNKQCILSANQHGDIQVSVPAHSIHTIVYKQTSAG